MCIHISSHVHTHTHENTHIPVMLLITTSAVKQNVRTRDLVLTLVYTLAFKWWSRTRPRNTKPPPMYSPTILYRVSVSNVVSYTYVFTLSGFSIQAINMYQIMKKKQ